MISAIQRKNLRGRIIIDSPVREASNTQSKEAFENKDPRPTGSATYTIQFGDGASEESTKSTSSRSSREEQSHAKTAFMSRIPHGDEVADARKKATFGDTKEDATGEKAAEVVYQSHASHDETPRYHDGRQPNTWTEALHHHVAWDLGRNVKWEENGKSDVVIQSFHTKINFQLDETRVTNISAIEEAEPTDRGQ